MRKKDGNQVFGVIGTGRFGLAVAEELLSRGKYVIALDQDQQRLKELGGVALRRGDRFFSAAAALFPVTATIIAQILNFSHFWQIPHKIGTIYKQGGSKRLRPVKNERKCITMPAV